MLSPDMDEPRRGLADSEIFGNSTTERDEECLRQGTASDSITYLETFENKEEVKGASSMQLMDGIAVDQTLIEKWLTNEEHLRPKVIVDEDDDIDIIRNDLNEQIKNDIEQQKKLALKRMQELG